MAGCPNPHTVKLPDGTEKKFDNEIEFKKYLAKGGLLELQKAKLINIDLGFMKEFFVPKKKESVKSTVKRTTEGKAKGRKVLVDEYSGLIDQMRISAKVAKAGFKEGVKQTKEQFTALQGIVGGLRDELKKQIKEAKSTVFKGVSIKGSVASKMLASVNNAKTPLQILGAIDKMQKLIDDVEYDNKVTRSKSLAKTAIKRSKGLPSNVRAAVKRLASIRPSSIEDVSAYLNTIESVVSSIKDKGAEGINVDQLNSLSDKIVKTNLKERLDRIYNLYPELKQEVNNSIKDIQAALDEANKDILENKDTSDEITAEEKREALESIAEVLREELDDYDTSDIDTEDLELFNTIKELDIKNLSDKDLIFLNHAINNFLENGEFNGVGARLLSKYKIQQSFTDNVISSIKDGVVKIGRVAKFITTWGSLPTKLSSVTSNENVAAIVRIATGLADHIKAYGAKGGFLDTVETGLNYVDKLAQSTGIKQSYKSQVKIGIVLDLLQTKPSMTPTEIIDEFEKRKTALIKGIENAKEQAETNSEYKDIHGEYLKNVEDVYNEIVKDSKSPEDLLSKLTPNEKKFRDGVLNMFLDLRYDLERASRIYNNKEFDIYDNYFPRTYIRPYGVTVAGAEGVDSILSMSSYTGTPNIETKVSTSFDDRKINNGSTPKESIVNYSVLDVFQDNYRKQVYDVKTMPTRYYMASVLTSPEFLDALGKDRLIRDLYQKSFAQRIGFEKQGLIVPKAESNTRFIWNTLNSLGNKIALGGILTPFLKQFLPAFASTAINTSKRPTLILDSLRDITRNREAFNKLIEQSPVYGRHKREAQFLNAQVNAKDIKVISNKLKRGIKWWDDSMDEIFMKSLKSGDQSAAGLSYLTYYKYSLLEQGKISKSADFDISKEAKSPNKIAQQYAEQMTSTTLNINEAVDRAEKDLGGGFLPFIRFAVNAKLNLAINISKAINSNGVLSKKDKVDIARRISAHAAEILTINLIGYAQRYLMIGIGTASSAALMGIGADDEEKEEIYKKSEEVKRDLRKKNLENTWKYVIADLLTGQIAESFVKPIMEQIWTPFTESYEKVSGGIVDSKPNSFSYQNSLAILGARSIPIVKGIEFVKSAGELMQPDELFRQQKFGYINSRDEIAVPHWAENIDKPIGERVAFTATSLINLIATFGASAQEINTMSRNMSRMMLELEKERFGKDKKLQDLFKTVPSSIYKYNKIEEENATIKYNGVEYYLTPEQLAEWNKFREDAVKKQSPVAYEKFKRVIPKIVSQLQKLKGKTSDSYIKNELMTLEYIEDPAEKAIVESSKNKANRDMIEKYRNPKYPSKLSLNLKKDAK